MVLALPDRAKFATELSATLEVATPGEIADSVGKTHQAISLWRLGKAAPAPRHIDCLIRQLQKLRARKSRAGRAKRVGA